MKTYFIAGHMIHAEDCVRGIFVNPVLPSGFNNTANESRPFTHMIWWMQPYILQDKGEEAATVCCLDGGAWDRASWRGNYENVTEAADAARKIRDKGNHMIAEATLLPGMTDSYGMTPLKFD